MSDDLDITGSLRWEDGLPIPRWDLLSTWVEARAALDAPHDVWTVVARQWMAQLGRALGDGYEVAETDHFVGVLWPADPGDPPLLGFAEKCRRELLSGLAGVADFAAPGKQVVVALRDQDDYYRYISPYSPEGVQGGSAGLHIRAGYPHVALVGSTSWAMSTTLAHELTHTALHHLAMPLWLEEGLAQMFEHNMTGRLLLELDPEKAAGHKRYWSRRGLDAFWRGAGFGRPGKVQELTYQLAEILVRIMVEDSRPRWFGLVKEPRRRFYAFLREARDADCGQAACREHLGHGLGDLAAKFLGPGKWEPGL